MQDERARVLSEIEKQLRMLGDSGFAGLIPEVGSNLAYALEGAGGPGDVAAVPGRIRNAMGKPVFIKPRFGASSHVSSIILAAMRRDPGKRCALNIRYSPGIISALESMGLNVVFIDRMSEPDEIKDKEGASVPWVFEMACGKSGQVPDVIYHRGAVGKEAITQIIGKDPAHVTRIVMRLLEMV